MTGVRAALGTRQLLVTETFVPDKKRVRVDDVPERPSAIPEGAAVLYFQRVAAAQVVDPLVAQRVTVKCRLLGRAQIDPVKRHPAGAGLENRDVARAMGRQLGWGARIPGQHIKGAVRLDRVSQQLARPVGTVKARLVNLGIGIQLRRIGGHRRCRRHARQKGAENGTQLVPYLDRVFCVQQRAPAVDGGVPKIIHSRGMANRKRRRPTGRGDIGVRRHVGVKQHASRSQGHRVGVHMQVLVAVKAYQWRG